MRVGERCVVRRMVRVVRKEKVKGGDEGWRVRTRVQKRLVCLEVHVRLVFGRTDQGLLYELVQSGGTVDVSVLLCDRRF